MINDQAAKLRQMMKSFNTRARVITITSGKGGVGKTVVAVNLAYCLSAAGKTVYLVDGDFGLANVDILLGLNCPYNIFHVISGRISLEAAVVELTDNLRVLPGGSGDRFANLSEFDRGKFIEILSDLKSQADWIIIDSSAGISRNVITLSKLADLIMVVTTPEPSALTDAYAMIKTLAANDVEGRICVITNRVSSYQEARRVHSRLADVARRFLHSSIYDAGYVLDDQMVPQSVRARRPLVLEFPKSQASYCIMSIAAKLVRAAPVEQRKVGWLRRVVNLFR